MDCSSPILLTVYRGGFLESHHHGALTVVTSNGTRGPTLGDPCKITLMRSTAKPLQTLSLMEGPADAAFHFSEAELTIMAASHDGEQAHTRLVRSILRKIGLDKRSLRCGSHQQGNWLGGRRVRRDVLQNNCSGKHAGMLAQCRALHVRTTGYESPRHPVQRRILRTASLLMELPVREIGVSFDNCSAPTFAVPLWRIALLYARLASPLNLTESIQSSVERLFNAVVSHPTLLSGRNRPSALISHLCGPRILIKEGGEGVCAVAVRPNNDFPSGLGIVIKVDDGAERAIVPVLIEALRQLNLINRSKLADLRKWHRPTIFDFRSNPVGRLEPEFELHW